MTPTVIESLLIQICISFDSADLRLLVRGIPWPVLLAGSCGTNTGEDKTGKQAVERQSSYLPYREVRKSSSKSSKLHAFPS